MLLADDTVFLSASGGTDATDSFTSIHDSQDIFFDPEYQSQRHFDPVSFVRNEKKHGKADGVSNNLRFENLHKLTRRKRLRSDSFSTDVNDADGESKSGQEQGVGVYFHDPWWPSSLAARLLLSKADVLIPSQGYNDEVMSCLCR